MSTFGTLFRVTTYGESHCESVGCIVDGCPPGLPLTNELIQPQLTRRRPGQSSLTTPRNESDAVKIQSGTEHGVTLGTPIALRILNLDQRPHDYSEMDLYPRPSHADWTYLLKYGLKASSGGGRSSARETIGRVAAGAIAEQFLLRSFETEIVAFVASAGHVAMPHLAADANPKLMQLLAEVTREQVDQHITRCPDQATAVEMQKLIEATRDAKDSIGGTILCVIRNPPKGLGEPCFDKLEAKLAHAMLSIPATKGFEIGSGFQGAKMLGSQHNDMWVARDGGLSTLTNHSGGIQGGISNGEQIYFRVAFKPAATIGQSQQTATYHGVPGTLSAKGRHDPCVLPRAIPIIEAMAALVVIDAYLIQASRMAALKSIPPSIGIHPSLLGQVPPKPQD
ncbi:bifunctional chorismate synthase/riboflavin reductase [NAD(P)H] aro2 [Massospora cicadina]|nr:bifunctional chorismate synthase/riboflavin reductase [NAD(P)H] aro2 [Massospora cicadina]